ncbi:TRAP transporter substrate-binding protein (plasmid) [Natrinema zhouii]|nr:TAXI family TRAP transporter solute-binding subunit [Natrinema zhouii]UHQ98813.1 TRAP transporter substrate-binding protein [Natrinema zhouii]
MKGATTLGAISMAGCLGGGGGDQYQMTIAGAGSGTSTEQAAQALARAASQNSDSISITVQNTDGWTANLYEFDNDNFGTVGVDNNSLSKAMNEEGPFAEDPVDSLPMQGFVFTSLEIHWVAMEGSDLESTADLQDGGYTIYPIQPGFGTRLLTEEVIREAGLWDQNEILNVDSSDIPGAVEEGRADALCVYGANGVNLSSWVQEVDVRSNGGLYLMEVDDNFRQAIENVPGAILKEFDEYPYEWEQDVTTVTDTTTSWVLSGQWAFGPDVPADAVKEVARLSAEEHESIRDADPTAIDHSGVESMTAAVIPDLEIHPGVAEYWQDNDVWNDEWTEGSTNE